MQLYRRALPEPPILRRFWSNRLMPTTPPRQVPAPPIVLSFAASDPTAGAGIQADMLSIAGMGCHPVTVITAITVQDTTGVEDVLPLDAGWVEDQARTILEDMPVAAFKIGMLGSAENVAAIAEIVADYPNLPLVFDPVLASGRGDQLSNEEMIEAMQELLLPQTTILTPNSLEARRLAEAEEDDTPPDLAECAHRLVNMGCEFVLVTGTHENTSQVINTLYGSHGSVRSDSWQRLPGSYHGSGCTLASALAAALAQGMGVEEAVREAQHYTWQTLAHGFRAGMGQHIPDRFFWARAQETDPNTPQDPA